MVGETVITTPWAMYVNVNRCLKCCIFNRDFVHWYSSIHILDKNVNLWKLHHGYNYILY